MRTTSKDTIYSEQLADIEGFEILAEALVEYMHPDDTFDWTVDDRAEVLSKIDNGTWIWFCAKVSAWKHGVCLASEYLGCCLYDSFDDFCREEAIPLAYEAVKETKATIAKLAA